MESPVNLDNLRAITDGDAEMEAELFRIFLDSSVECLTALRAAKVADDENAWRREAHAFKGICFNLGAETLGGLCKTAQEDCRAAPDEKEIMIAKMEEELNRVRQMIGVHP